jgi:hypothetical protein
MTTRSTQELLAALLTRELRAFRREIGQYPDDEAPWRTLPGIANAGGTLALHVAGNLQHYVGARLGATGYVRDRPAEFARRDVPRALLVAELDRAIDVVQRVLPAVDDATMEAAYPEEVGGRRLTTRDFVAHLLAHLAYHLGQVDYHRRAVTGDGATVGAVAIDEVAG